MSITPALSPPPLEFTNVFGLPSAPLPDQTAIAPPLTSNRAPIVYAGGDLTTNLGNDVTLNGDVLVNLALNLSVTWSMISGPGTVVFADQSAASTTAAFSVAGTYELSLTADNSGTTASDRVTITVANNNPPGLVGYWPFEEGNGQTTEDVSGTGNDAIVSGATWTTNGRVGNALRFDGSNDFVDTGNWDVDSGQLTIATWFKADDFGVTDARLLSKATGVLEQDHFWMLSTIQSNGPKLRFRLKAAGTTKTLIADSGNLLAGQWMHAAAVYDGAMMRLYLNGTEVGATPHSGAVSTNANVPVSIGNNPGGTKPFDGLIDQVRVYDRALSPVEISALIAQAPASNQAPIVNAGPDRSVVVSTALALDGTVSDDGLPNPSNTVTTTWNRVSGPGAVTFGNASSVDTTAVFAQAGTYVLSLTADDGELTTIDSLTVTVTNEQAVNGFFVSPNGTSGGDGSINNPWDLATAVAQPTAVQPGDTIWLRGGTYRGGFTSKLSGTQSEPITVRAYPGERATIDTYIKGAALSKSFIFIKGDYSTWYGLEIMNSRPDDRWSDYNQIPPWGGNIPTYVKNTQRNLSRGMIMNSRTGTRFINLIVHDMIDGLQSNTTDNGGELYGNILYNNGFFSRTIVDGPLIGRDHGIYVENASGTKIVSDNILFDNFANGLHEYGQTDQFISGISTEGNTSFNNGSIDILVGAWEPAQDINFISNYTYNTQPTVNRITFGWKAPADGNLTFVDNYLASGGLTFRTNWGPIASSGNTVVGTLQGPTPGTGITLDPTPTGERVFVRPNQYEAGRANITIYNWNENPTVNVDLSGVLTVGSSYEVHDVYDLFSTPVASGVYNGGTIVVPMTTRSAPSALGNLQGLRSPTVQGPEFGAFVVTTISPVSASELNAATTPTTLKSDVIGLNQLKLAPLIDQAIEQWIATGLSPDQVHELNQVKFLITDLPGTLLAQASSQTVVIDQDAAGHGWFVDQTPELSEEFISQGLKLVANHDSPAANKMDLLTVLNHELGHLLGYDHSSDGGLMDETLDNGIRKSIDLAFAQILQ